MTLTPKPDSDARRPSEKITTPDGAASRAPQVSAKAAAEGVNCENWDKIFFFTNVDIVDVNRCLQAGLDPNARGEGGSTPLGRAVIDGNAETVAALLNAGADVNALSVGSTPLHKAALFKKAEAVTILLEAGADPNARSTGGDTPLHRAAGSGEVEILMPLLKAGADVNVQGLQDLTPLMYAVTEPYRAEVMRVLLEVGADPQKKDVGGMTALHRAEYVEAVVALIVEGAFLEARDRAGRTPLHWAAMKKNMKTVNALIDAGADLNARDNYRGYTPLHWAAIGSKNDEVVSALLMAGADPNARDNEGDLAYDSSGLIRRFRERGDYRARPARRRAERAKAATSPTHGQRRGPIKTRPPLRKDAIGQGVPQDLTKATTNPWPQLPHASPKVHQRPQLAPVPSPDSADIHFVSENVTPPTVLSRIEPIYSEEARRANVEGTVELSAVIRKDGSIEVVKVLRGLGLGLDENAIKALKKWRFRPGMKDGRPVDVALNIEVRFSLR